MEESNRPPSRRFEDNQAAATLVNDVLVELNEPLLHARGPGDAEDSFACGPKHATAEDAVGGGARAGERRGCAVWNGRRTVSGRLARGERDLPMHARG